jgi:hypothetical protein
MATGPGPAPAALLATFDTRYDAAAWRVGSAATRIARRLRAVWPQPVVAPQSFFVAQDAAELLPGEVERARRWAAALGVRALHAAGQAA